MCIRDRIRNELFSFADKIEKGEKTTFAASSTSKEVIEHDRKIFIACSEILDSKFFRIITNGLLENRLISEENSLLFEKFNEFLIDPSNEFLTISIAQLASELSDLLIELQKFITRHFYFNSNLPNYPDLIMTLEISKRKANSTNEDEDYELLSIELQTIVENVVFVFNRFRKEVKHKLII